MAATVFESPYDLKAAVGKHLGYSPWMTIDQDRIDKFADATNDHQWIHVDVERAKTGPFGATIAHGYLSLSLVSSFMPQIFEVRGFEFAVNYGTNKVRFPNAVKCGARIRGGGDWSRARPAGSAARRGAPAPAPRRPGSGP